jgi:hypothetical protein
LVEVVQRRGRLADERRQGMLRLGEARLEARDLRPRLLGVRAGLLHVQLGGEPGLGAPPGEVERLLLAGEAAAGDREARLVGAQLDVAERHLRDERDLRVVQARLAGLDIGLGRAHRLPRRPEEVQLPARVETGRVRLSRVAPGRLAGAGANRAVDAWQEGDLREAALRPRLPKAGLSGPEIRVGEERLLDELRERSIAESFPPAREVSGRPRRGLVARPLPDVRHRHRRRHRLRGRGGTAGGGDRDEKQETPLRVAGGVRLAGVASLVDSWLHPSSCRTK